MSHHFYLPNELLYRPTLEEGETLQIVAGLEKTGFGGPLVEHTNGK